MVTCFVAAYAVVLLALLCGAGCVALCVPDQGRRADAVRVLKLLIGVLAGACGANGLIAALPAFW